MRQVGFYFRIEGLRLRVESADELHKVLDAGGCRRSLVNLRLSGGRALEDVNVLASCAALRALDLSGCPNLSDVSALTACAGLETLDLSGCFRLADVAALARTGLAPDPLVGGDDLLEAGMPPGPSFRMILDRVYDAQLEGRLQDRESALAMALELAAEGDSGNSADPGR